MFYINRKMKTTPAGVDPLNRVLMANLSLDFRKSSWSPPICITMHFGIKVNLIENNIGIVQFELYH